MLEGLAGFAMGLCVGVVPTAFALGAMHQQKLAAQTRAEVVRELHKAVVDVGGRISTWVKGKRHDETKLGAFADAYAGAGHAGHGAGMDVQGQGQGRAGGQRERLAGADSGPTGRAGTQGKDARAGQKAVGRQKGI